MNDDCTQRLDGWCCDELWVLWWAHVLQHSASPPPLLDHPHPCSDEEAFKRSVECITGPISKTVSTQGMPAVYNMLDDAGKKVREGDTETERDRLGETGGERESGASVRTPFRVLTKGG